MSDGPSPGTAKDAFRIALPNFEGPLDLLLHLIKEHKLDIFDIPIALVTEKYIEHLEKMREVNLDIAGEFLVMAATLAQLKSRLLLPKQEVAAEPEVLLEEHGDPRGELVRRLLEYQKYKEAAEQLGRQDLLERDVFTRKVPVEKIAIPEEEVGLVEVSVYKLIEALDRVLQTAEPQFKHEVVREQLSLPDAVQRIVVKLRAVSELRFEQLFEGQRVKSQMVITFLALLEMCKRRLVRVFQAEPGGDILISVQGNALDAFAEAEVDDEYQG